MTEKRMTGGELYEAIETLIAQSDVPEFTTDERVELVSLVSHAMFDGTYNEEIASLVGEALAVAEE